MEGSVKMWQIIFVIISLVFQLVDAKGKESLIVLTEDTWQDMLDGEWLVKL